MSETRNNIVSIANNTCIPFIGVTLDTSIDYPMLLSDMISCLYSNKLLSPGLNYMDLFSLWNRIQASSLYWEICATAWIDIWENDTPILRAITDAYYDWEK